MSRRAVFVDRDGTLIVDQVYARDPDAVRLVPGAAEALVRLREAGFVLVLVSNQSGVGRGLITPGDVDAVHARMIQELARLGASLDAAYYCLHAPWDDCACRKPRPGMLLRAAGEMDLDRAASWLVGDQPTDMGAAEAAGVQGAKLGDWAEIVATILGDLRGPAQP
jgi:D-glycero-D-manno-heptose 1,7-bisphosphate phosphatase